MAEGGPVQASIALPVPLPGSSQLLAMPSCCWNLDMSSFNFLAVLTLWKTVPHCPWRGTGVGGGEEEELPGAFGAVEPPCFHGKSGLWACLSVVPLC